MNRSIDIGGHTFQFVCQIEPERDEIGAILEFMPQGKYKNKRSLPLSKHGIGPFCRYRIPKNWHQEGVYLITRDGEVVYIGKCIDLTYRHNTGYGQISPKNCFEGGQPTNCRINAEILKYAKSGHQFELWFLSTSDSDKIEIELISNCSPAWNRQHRDAADLACIEERKNDPRRDLESILAELKNDGRL